MVLDDASERKIHHNRQDGIAYFADIPLGLYIVRGDSMVLLGQVGQDDTGNGMKQLQLVELEEMVAGTTRKESHEGEHLEWDFDKDLLA
jgi:hypothetical protein